MKRKQALTLIELMIVIFLIGIIGSVIGYNMMGSMEKGKKFKTEQGLARLHDIVNLQNSLSKIEISNNDNAEDRRTKVRELLTSSGLIKSGNVEDYMKDGWGDWYHISVSDGEILFRSTKYDRINGTPPPQG